MDLRRAAGQGRYAQLEREQRWRLRGLPPGVDEPVSIVDLYLTGTRLRLRRAEARAAVVYKLGQKVRLEEGSPTHVKLTNLYLSPAEYEILRRLPGRELRKTRWRLIVQDRSIAVDEFQGALSGLILAEVELSPDEEPLTLPHMTAIDVSTDDRFSGGRLAETSAAEVAELLSSVEG